MLGSVIDKEESKLAVIDPFTNEKIQDAKEDEDAICGNRFRQSVIVESIENIENYLPKGSNVRWKKLDQ